MHKMVFIAGIVIASLIIYSAHLLYRIYLWIKQPITIVLLSGYSETSSRKSLDISPIRDTNEIYEYYFSKNGYKHLSFSNIINELAFSLKYGINIKRYIISHAICKQIHFYSNICIYFLQKILLWNNIKYRHFVITDYQYIEQKEYICNFFPNARCISIWISPHIRQKDISIVDNTEVKIKDCDYVINHNHNRLREKSLIAKIEQIMASI